MKKIPLTKGKFVLVDDEDFEELSKYNWHTGAGGYALRRIRHGKEKRENIWMHRLLNKTPEGFQTDHINRNTFDNRKENLRTVTASQNRINVGATKANKSGVRGVCWKKLKNVWESYIVLDYKMINLGQFKNKEDAINARKEAELIYHQI